MPLHAEADEGLLIDLPRLIAAPRARPLGRRDLLRAGLGLGMLSLIGCGSNGNSDCEIIPTETEGPYPGDGTNGANALTQSGIVRSDIRASFGSSTTVAEGIPLTVILTLVNSSGSCEPLAGRALYLWHCNRAGLYSLYGQGITGENYLRGVQETDSNGQVTFKTIFPAAYSGRWPHIHFEVFESLAKAVTGKNKVAVSQLALPEATCNLVYATSGYEQSISNLKQTSLSKDNVFGDDDAVQQLAGMSGSVSEGFTAKLTVPIET